MQGTFEQAEKCNQELWDEIAPIHAKAYKEVDILKEGGIVLDEIELREIGEVEGKTLLHLQCHIGTDTLSWARQGATVTGVDFSEKSLACARQLQQELQLDATFVHANVYDLRTVLDDQFDIVYTSRGVLCWLRDLEEWARIIAHFLKPGGIFYMMEAHPICNVFDEAKPGELAIVHPYFHTPQPTLWADPSPDYADESYIPQHPSYEWNWSLSDILNALLKAGLLLESFNEYDRLFFKCFPGMVNCSERWYCFPQYARKLPLLFTVRARKLGIISDSTIP
jgi:ubiquinone/menaquinone biosynthesis C-methylase UbiE